MCRSWGSPGYPTRWCSWAFSRGRAPSSKAPTAVEKLDPTVTRLAPFQGIVGLAGMTLAVWTVLDLYVFHL
jgi:hypothetical protein